ncbi:MAG: N-acetylglucosamine-6-phosphate deacetylase [Candidatus Acidoferrum typicum]|nr:N-acetylglucosamine-6-phosphate deacetylase [Candidatus Acidoferrum typicum]
MKLPILPRALIYVLCVLTLPCLPKTASAQAQPTTYAITHAKIFTLSGTIIDDGTVVIQNGKIANVGAAVEVPVGAQVIDGKGLQVYPGLFDPVTQMGLREIGAVSATVDSAETGQFNPDVVAAEAVLPSSEHIPVTRASGITEVLAVPASGGMDSGGATGILGGQASAIHMSGWTISDMLLKKSVAMVLNWPTIETKTFDFSTFSRKEKSYSDAKQEYEKQVIELTDWLERARHYAQALGHGGAGDFQRDVKLDALVPVTRGELPVLVFADKARDIRGAVEFCEKQKLKMILGGGAEAYKVKDLLRSKGIPVILGPTLTLPGEEDDPYDRLLTQPAELAAAGVKFAFGSFDNSFARRLGQQAANAVAYGLPYDEALKAVTLYPAEIFGLADQVGTLESGKIANVIVTNGDPLELTTEVRYLFIKGQLTSLDNKQKALYEKYLNRPKAK